MNDGIVSIVRGDLQDVLDLEHRLPEFKRHHRLTDLKARLSPNGLILKAVLDKQLTGSTRSLTIGVKAGYPLNASIFYSWIGGVLPQYRGQHIAQRLLEAQETWTQEQGYHQIQVKTRNPFKPMIYLLLKNDYWISGYEDLGDPWQSKIVFAKYFNSDRKHPYE